MSRQSTGAALVGVTTFAAMAPRFVMPPVAGYLADRFDRRSLLLATYLAQAAQATVLTALVMTGSLEAWHLMVLSVINGTVRTVQMTVTNSLVPVLVPRQHVPNAVALSGVTINGSRFLGPALIAPALAVFGPGAAFLVSTLLYLAGTIGVLQVRTRASGGLGRGSGFAAGLWQAARYVWAEPRLRALFFLIAFHCSMTMAYESILPALARDVFGDPEAGVSYLMMGVGARSVASVVLIAGVRSELARGRLLLTMGVASGASMLGLAASHSMAMAVSATAAMGASQAGFMAIGNAIVQTLAPDHMRGRITGLDQINIGGTMALMNLANGIAADSVGPAPLLTFLGLGFVGVMAVSLVVATLRGIRAGLGRVAAAA